MYWEQRGRGYRRKLGDKAILEALSKMGDKKFQEQIKENLKKIENGARDLSV